MQTPSNLQIWLGEQFVPLAIIAALLTLVMVILFLSARARHLRMNEARSQTNEETFVDALLQEGFEPTIARATYQYLQTIQRVSFPIEPSDLLDEDLGLSSADVDETVRDLLASTERLFQPGLAYAPLVTVTDLVKFLQASPKLSELAA